MFDYIYYYSKKIIIKKCLNLEKKQFVCLLFVRVILKLVISSLNIYKDMELVVVVDEATTVVVVELVTGYAETGAV